MSFGTMVIIAIGVVLLWGAILGARGQKKWEKNIAEQFSKAGLVNSPGAKGYVEKSITTLFHSKADRMNEIKNIKKISFESKEVYFCDMNLHGVGRLNSVFTDVFLFPLRLKTDQPLIIFFKSDCAEGDAYVKDIITKNYVLSDLYKPDNLPLINLSTPQELEMILFAYSTKETSLATLVSSALLSNFFEAGKYGFFGIYCRNGTAALLTLQRHINHQIYDIDWDHQWQYVQRLMRF